MQLFLNSYGAYLHKVGNMFEVVLDNKKTKIAPQRIQGIVISNAIQISSDAVKLALEHNIDILFIDEHGNPYGRIWLPRLGRTASIRRKLLEIYSTDSGLQLVKGWTVAKINNQIQFLKRVLEKRPSINLSNELQSMNDIVAKIHTIEGKLTEIGSVLMGYEGNAGRHYFKVLSQSIPAKYKFAGRSSRPAKDEFNCFLNYGYGILYGKVEKSLILAGLDPYIGLLHKDNYQKRSLVYDFIEPYRILVEIPIFYLFSRQRVQNSYTEPVVDGLKLSEDGKRFMLPYIMEYFDEIIRHSKQNIKRINQIQVDAHQFASKLIGDEKDI